eukprot:TRINITY_DN13491_c0_g1_i1.p1 TRINITY_DN13491_c0_g1~~TRINITY_DN13491_c0_g1_i1.p1  ORF type:complete len:588 (+),score=67.69 TRINITY_DN13491_c0_g1_i1:59-1822(+)
MMQTESEARQAFWEGYCYVKGDTGGTGKPLAALVIGRDEIDSSKFFIFGKGQVRETRAVVPLNLGRYLVVCGGYRCGRCHAGAACEMGHVEGELISLDVKTIDENLLILDRRGKALFSAKTKEAEDTVGLRVGCYLKKTALYKYTKLYLCEDFTLRTCPRGGACPYVHAAPDFLQPKFLEEYPPDIHGQHTILEAFQKLEEHSDVHVKFAKRLEEEQGLFKVRDLNILSNEVFRYLSEIYGGEDVHLYSLLEQVRLLPDELSIKGALKKFDEISTAKETELKYLSDQNIRNIRDLSRVKFNTLLSMPISSSLKSCLQLMRERRRPRDGTNVLFEVLDIAGLPSDSPRFITDILNSLTQYETTTDVSWRRLDGKSLIVSTAITYVRGCTCGKALKTNGGGVGPLKVTTPRKPSRFMPYPTLSPALHPSSPPFDGEERSGSGSGGAAAATTPAYWCGCPREVVYSVNYELSTPSGSRCSEQNGLGRIASSGVPTSAIREVFVRGRVPPPTPDPNPLFPCGVCESMFRKLSREVFQKHGADIMLYMFDVQDPRPKKLIRMPFTEISHRESPKFKMFINEEIRDAATDPEP